MAKKTVKKQPLKAAPKVAAKASDKNTKKVAKKASESVKAKPTKVASGGTKPKKEEKPTKVAKAPVVVAKKAEEKKTPAVPEKVKATSAKGKIKPEVPEVELSAVAAPEPEATEIVEPTKKVKVPKEKKKSALQKKKEKMEFDSNAKWADFFEKYKAVKPANYSMKDAFEANQPIQHKVLGWGWVISSENDRLEVLFKDGKKILISNYKS